MISPFAVLPRMLGVESAVYNINLRYLKLEMRPSTTLKRVLPANGTVFTDIAEVPRNWIHLSCSTLATDSLELVLHHLPLDWNTEPIIEDSLLDLATSDRITDLTIRLDGFLLSHFSPFIRNGLCNTRFQLSQYGRWTRNGTCSGRTLLGSTLLIFSPLNRVKR